MYYYLILHCFLIMENLFDKVNNISENNFFQKKENIQIKQHHKCCGLDFIYDEYYTYTKCQNIITNGFACDKHSLVSIIIKIDNKNGMTTMFRKFNYQGQKISNFKELKIIFFPNKNAFIILFYSFKKIPILKAFVKDDKHLNKLIHIIDSMFIKNTVNNNIIKYHLEPFYFIYKNILNIILYESIICKDVLSIINDTVFLDSDFYFFTKFFDRMINRMNNQNKEYKIFIFLELFSHLFNYYENLIKVFTRVKDAMLICFDRNNDDLIAHINQCNNDETINKYNWLLKKTNSFR